MTTSVENGAPDTGLWVLEWSQKSNNLHVRPLTLALGMNSCRFVMDAPTSGDYIPLAVGTHDEVSKHADFIRPTVIDREKSRAQDRGAIHG